MQGERAARVDGGLIFDLDDTLVGTAAVWREAEQRLLASVGHTWSASLAARYKGMNAPDVAATIHRALRLKVDLPALQQRMRAMLIEAFDQATITPMDGAVALARGVADLAPMAVASGSPQPVIETVLRRIGLADAFAATITSESVPRGKPHPDVFISAASALGVSPARCLVFEDSLPGVQAARAAGMPCFVVPSLHAAQMDGDGVRRFRSWRCVTRQTVADELVRIRRKPAGAGRSVGGC